MFSWDRWQEVLETVRRHRLRTFLTGLSVAWGIFMLVLLLGSGNGLRHAVEDKFKDDATNSIWVFRGRTSMPYRGHRPGRQIQLSLRDFDAVRHNVDDIEYMSGRFRVRGNFSVRYGKKTSAFSVVGAHPDHRHLEKTIVTDGRYLNHIDIRQRRKVAVIGDEVARTLFGEKSPLGEYIEIAKTPFRVVGVFIDEGSIGEARRIWIPITAAQTLQGADDKIHMMLFTVGDATTEESLAIEDEVISLMASRHQFDPGDKRALRVRNNLEMFKKFTAMFDWIAIFVWLVGAGTILAGIVGVSNIMLISVKERTVEFGVRKAVGATPMSIVGMVLAEAVVLTSVAGYLGLVAGVGVLELAARFLPANDYFSNPSIDMAIAVTAMGVLVVAGSLAGLFPARKAARIRPVHALRGE